MLYPEGHPYRWPTIGYMEDLTAASYEDVVEFFKKYYEPANASLVIAGDIEPAKTRALVEKWFSDVKPGTAVIPPIDHPHVKLTGVKRKTLEDRVQLPRLYLAWLTPPLHRPGDAELDVVSQILAGGKNSRLYKRLVYDLQIAQDVSAFQASAALDSAFPDRRHVAAGRCGRDARGAHRSHPDDRGRGAGDAAEDAAGRARVRARDQPDRGVVLQPDGKRRRRLRQGKPAERLLLRHRQSGLLQRGPVALPRADGLRRPGGGRVLAARRQARRAERRAGEKAVTMQPALSSATWRLKVSLAPGPQAFCSVHRPRRARLRRSPGGTIVRAAPPDRSAPPKPGPPPALKLPAIQKRTLSNGLPVWIVELHKVPVVHVSLAVKAGSGADPRSKFGVANLTAEMLDEGAGARDALQIADGIDYLGASLSTSSTFDAAFVELHVPVARLGDALPIMADVALRPTFPEKELQRVARGAAGVDPPGAGRPGGARPVRVPAARLRPPAPLRHDVVRDRGVGEGLHASRISAVSRASLRPVERGAHRDRRRHAGLRRRAAGIRVRRLEGDGSAPPVPYRPRPQLTSRQVYLIDKPGAAQSQIRIGWVGVPRSTPDYFALRVLNTMLGGAFTSRLNQNLREEHGYAYGASSAFDMRGSAGPFYAAAGVQTDKTAEALTEFFKELDAIRKPIPAEELDKAKNYVALLLPRNFETTESLAGSLAQVFVYNLPADYYATFTDRVRAVTPADVQRAAERYLQPDKFAVVVVGDLKVIEPGIRALNLGPITTVTIDDVLK